MSPVLHQPCNSLPSFPFPNLFLFSFFVVFFVFFVLLYPWGSAALYHHVRELFSASWCELILVRGFQLRRRSRDLQQA